METNFFFQSLHQMLLMPLVMSFSEMIGCLIITVRFYGISLLACFSIASLSPCLNEYSRVQPCYGEEFLVSRDSVPVCFKDAGVFHCKCSFVNLRMDCCVF